MILQSGTILCIEPDEATRQSRCGALSIAGYTAVSASPAQAFDILSDRAFDVIVTAGLSEVDLKQILTRADGAEVLSLGAQTVSTVLLFMVDERLRQLRRKNDQ